MARIDPIPMEQAQGQARELLDDLVERGGDPGPMVRAMANAPALLRGYLELTRALKRGHVDRRITERINLAVHERLSSDYCLVAHTRAARRLGLPDGEIRLARQGTSSDPAIAVMQQCRPAPALGEAARYRNTVVSIVAPLFEMSGSGAELPTRAVFVITPRARPPARVRHVAGQGSPPRVRKMVAQHATVRVRPITNHAGGGVGYSTASGLCTLPPMHNPQRCVPRPAQ